MANDALLVYTDEAREMRSAGVGVPIPSAPHLASVAGEKVANGLTQIVDQLEGVLSKLPQTVGSMNVAEMKVLCHVSLDGSVSVLSLMKTGGSAKAGIELTFRR